MTGEETDDLVPHGVVGGTDPAPAGPAASGSPLATAATRPGGWWEVAAVLAVGVVPNLVGAVSALCHPPAASPYWLDALNLSVLSGCTVLVTLYLIGRSGEAWDHFGVVRPGPWDVVFGILLFLAAAFLASLMPRFLWTIAGAARDTAPLPRGATDHVLMVVKYGLSACAEEVVARAYLVTRLVVLLRSRVEAVLLSAALFASYHVYQGPPGVVYALAFGVVYGVAFLALGRVWPLVLGHGLYNMWVEALAT